jgi:hypothetical protein
MRWGNSHLLSFGEVMNRIKYDTRPSGLLVSRQTYKASDGFYYQVVIDPVNLVARISREALPIGYVVEHELKTISLHKLKKNVKRKLQDMGVTFEPEKRDRSKTNSSV